VRKKTAQSNAELRDNRKNEPWILPEKKTCLFTTKNPKVDSIIAGFWF
jgi:hypothetical protein